MNKHGWDPYGPGDLIIMAQAQWPWYGEGAPPSATTGIVLEFTPSNVYESAFVKALVDGREVYVECKNIKRAN